MILHGTRPARHISRERIFHKHFGGVATAALPDFNLDAGLTMPDQEADNAPTECVGYTAADILTDITKVPIDPDFSYAAARFVSGDGPGTEGASFHAGLQGLIAVGGLMTHDATFHALDRGELFVSDWNNWQPYQKTKALLSAQNGLYNVLGNGDNFSSILSALYTGRIAVSLGSPWFKEWQGLPAESILPMPADMQLQAISAYTPWHNYAAKGQKTINGQKLIPIKSWQGHWLYMPQDVANAVFALAGTGALTLNPKANRWWSLVGILLQRFPQLITHLPQLLNLNPHV